MLRTGRRKGLLSARLIGSGELLIHFLLRKILAYCSRPMLRPEARRLELECHAHLMRDHTHGEWFKASAEVAIGYLGGLTEQAVEQSVPVQLKLVS